MRRKVFRDGQEEWEDLGPGVGRRHTPAPPASMVSFMGEFVSVADARQDLEAHAIPLDLGEEGTTDQLTDLAPRA